MDNTAALFFALGIHRMKLSFQLPLSAEHQLTQAYGTTHSYALAFALALTYLSNFFSLLKLSDKTALLIVRK